MLEASAEGRSLIERVATPPAFELYDLKSDSGELVNLADNPEYQAILNQLKEELAEWREDSVADPLTDPVVLKEFAEEYAAHCKLWEAKAKEFGGSKKMQNTSLKVMGRNNEANLCRFYDSKKRRNQLALLNKNLRFRPIALGS
jgi:arylsulfatase A-like enzyme